MIGSHLDSVIEGGRYDGVAGVMAGLMVMRWAKEDGIRIPLRVGAFRCEESSNFGCCTIGSGLITHEVYKQDIGHLMSKDGESLENIFEHRGLTLHRRRYRDFGDIWSYILSRERCLRNVRRRSVLSGRSRGR